VTNQSLYVLSVVLPHFGFCAFARASAWMPRARQRIAAVHGVVARRSAKTDTCFGRQRVRTLGGRQNEAKLMWHRSKRGGQRK
jgi:hypothetical protein